MATPEHALQIMIHKWVKAHVAHPFVFNSVDRAKRSGQFTHVREKARGMLAGFPDTILLVNGMTITAELKALGKKPTERQAAVGEVIKASGHHWFWCDNVFAYAQALHNFGVPLVGAWGIAADGHDATLASAAIRSEESKTGKVSKKRRNPFAPRYVWKSANV